MPGRGGTWALSELESEAYRISNRGRFLLWLLGPTETDYLAAKMRLNHHVTAAERSRFIHKTVNSVNAVMVTGMVLDWECARIRSVQEKRMREMG